MTANSGSVCTLHSSLGANHKLILRLIKKELQDAKIVNELTKLGFSSAHFCPELGEVILDLLGCEERTNELWEWYDQTLDAHAAQINFSDLSNLDDLAVGFYEALKDWVKHPPLDSGKQR